MDALSPHPMLILGQLGEAHPLRDVLRGARQLLSGRAYHCIDRVDKTVLAEFNTSSLSCCIVIDDGDARGAVLLVKSAVADLPQTPVLLLTSCHTAALESQAIAAGADDCVGTAGLTAGALTRIVARTLQRADRRQRLLYAMPIPLLHATLQGTVHWANSAFLALFSCAGLDDVRSLGLESLIVSFAHRLNRAGAPDHFSSHQIIAQRRDGHRDVVMMISCLNRLAPEEGVQVTFTDITELERQRRQLHQALIDFKRAQNERDQMEKELRLAQKLESVGQLAAGIAHEINTPAQFVSDNLAFLQSAYHDFSPVFDYVRRSADPAIQQILQTADAEFLLVEAPKAIAQAQDGIGRIRKIVLALKEFAHPGSEDKAAADLNHVIENTVTLARGEWKHTAELKLELTANLPSVHCSASGIAQVVLNMVVNAAHAIADRKPAGDRVQTGDLALSVERRPAMITIGTALQDEHFVISIADTGCGMSEEVQARMFDPFFTTKEVGRGSGQGLAIARSIIVDQHQGSIKVESKVGEGTTFTLWLPLGARDAP